jgi:DNA-binding response OmpR family regulator
VILDLMLPKISGVDLMKQIRAEPEFSELPVIVFSNTYLTNMVQEAWKAGATKCLSKSNCSPRQVIDVIRSTLSNGAPKARAPHTPAAPVPAPPGTATPGPPAAGAQGDAAFLAQLRASFVAGLPATLAALRADLQGLVKSNDEPARLKQLEEMYRRVHTLTGNAGITGFALVAMMADAFEALLKELHEKPKNINASTLRTVASAVDFLAVLFQQGMNPDKQRVHPTQILVVDDEAISRRAVTYALEKAKLKCINVEDSQKAYELLRETSYDLIFLDVDMPGMNGFELCSKLRTLPLHGKTPVVFVTSLTDFESRANSMMSGGNDFIGKPFLFIELALKALVHILRGQVPHPKPH